ncbi:hypothetical protein N9M98_01935 [Candidatus Pseudothioglobus singularis]|nr:hypothetical protein [Candidatus Pseudothioglobus singularis]
MEIIKLLINIIKKILKYFFILLIIGGIIGGGVYLWQENENKKERELNLAFFTKAFPTSMLEQGKYVELIDWQVDDYINNPKGEYQYGFDGFGKIYYRQVNRDKTPPSVTFYHMRMKDDDDQFSSATIWMIDCPKGSSTTYLISENNYGTIKCSKTGDYLYTALKHTPDYDLDFYSTNISANGFSRRINTSSFDMDKLRQNKTLMKLKSDDS